MKNEPLNDLKREDGENSQFVTFTLNKEVYAVDAMNVQEIIELPVITRVPHLPDFFKGVVNLRGNIIPVIDLKEKFGMERREYKAHTCVIIMEFSGGVMGVIVDSVSDVAGIPDTSLAPPPEFGDGIHTDFIKNMGKTTDGLVMILDIEKVFAGSEADLLVNEPVSGVQDVAPAV